MRTCVWCNSPLPEPEKKGHRRREFCNDRCKQHHYTWHKQMKHDADMLAEPYWKVAYSALVEHYKFIEKLLLDRVADLTKAQKYIGELEERVKYYRGKCEDMQTDYLARLKALGMSEKDIEDFKLYWEKHIQRTWDDPI